MSLIIHSGAPGLWRMHNGVEVPRDPFTIGAAIVTAASAATGSLLSFGAFTIASYAVGTVAVGAALYGANYAISSLGKTSAKAGGIGSEISPALVNTPEARGTIRQMAAPRRRIYGRMLVGGIWSFYADHVPPYQYLQLVLCHHRISAVRAVIINKNRVAFQGGTPFGQILSPVAIEGQDYVGNLTACFRQGLPDQVIDPLLAAGFPASGSDVVFDAAGNVTNLPVSFRQRGAATASFRASFGSTQEIFQERWGQVPFINPMIEVDGAPIYDPRDPTQDPDDESTWKFTYNGRDVGRTAALVQADWQRQPFGGRQPTSKIRWDEVADAANYDEEVVHDKDGNPRARHLTDGLVLLNQNPRHVTEAMLVANRAFIVQSRGRIGWVADRPKDPVLTITEKDILGGFEFSLGTPKREDVNIVRTRFTPPEKDYIEDDGPVLDRADLRAAEDGDQPLEKTVRTPFTSDHRAVQWLSMQFLDETRLPKRLEIPKIAFAPKFLRRRIGDVIRVQHKRYPEINGIYQLRQDGIAGDFSSLSWSLRQYDKDIPAASRAGDEQDFEVAA